MNRPGHLLQGEYEIHIARTAEPFDGVGPDLDAMEAESADKAGYLIEVSGSRLRTIKGGDRRTIAFVFGRAGLVRLRDALQSAIEDL